MKEKLERFFYSFDYHTGSRDSALKCDYGALVKIWYLIFTIFLPITITAVVIASIYFKEEIFVIWWFIVTVIWCFIPYLIRFIGLWIQLCFELKEQIQRLFSRSTC